MSQERKKYDLTNFFTGYIDNFKEMLIVNMLYCIPLGAFTGIVVMVFWISGRMDLFGLLLGIPVMSPFTGGLLYVCRKVTAGDEIKGYRDFMKGTRENWKFFSINGIVVYIVTIGLYITFTYFSQNLDKPLVIAYLTVSILGVIFFFFMELSITVMAVTVELKPAEIIKNSVILVILGIVKHLMTLVSLAFISAVLTPILLLTIHQWQIFLTVTGIMILTFLPTLTAYTCTYNTYQTIQLAMSNVQCAMDSAPAEPTMEELTALAQGDPEEFVSLHGTIVKRKYVQSILKKHSANR